MHKGIETLPKLYLFSSFAPYDPTAEMHKGIETAKEPVTKLAIIIIMTRPQKCTRGLKLLVFRIFFPGKNIPWPDRRNAQGDWNGVRICVGSVPFQWPDRRNAQGDWNGKSLSKLCLFIITWPDRRNAQGDWNSGCFMQPPFCWHLWPDRRNAQGDWNSFIPL